MSKWSVNDQLFIISGTAQGANLLKESIDLRGLESILALSFEQAPAVLLSASKPPSGIVLIDAEGAVAQARALVTQLPKESVQCIVLNNQYDEDFFLACHDAGARDVLTKPVPDAYLISRILHAFETQRLNNVLKQRDELLTELSVISKRSGTFTTTYLVRMLQNAVNDLLLNPDQPLSLLIIELGGYAQPISGDLELAVYTQVANVIKQHARASDVIGELFEDKFVVVLPSTYLDGAKSLAGRLAQQLNGLTISGKQKQATLTTAFGIADYQHCRHYEDFMQKALYNLQQFKQAKQNPNATTSPNTAATPSKAIS